MRILTILFFIISAGALHAQVLNQPFPDMAAETIENEAVSLPSDSKGKYTLLGLAYSKKSEGDLNTWFEPVYLKFIAENSGLFSSFSYDVNVFFVPMFTGVKTAAAKSAKKKAAQNIDPRLHPYILFYKGELKTYKDKLNFEKKDVPYFFVLDEEGTIVYATSGAYSDAKMDQIEEVME